MIKKLNMLFVIMLLSLVVVKPTEAQAYEATSVSKEVKDAVIRSLNDIEPLKEDFFGTSELEFEELQIGSAIYGYECVGNEYREVVQFFPLFYDEELIAVASEVAGAHYQLETKLAEDISARNVRNCAIIYSADGLYLYDGIDFILIMSYATPVNNRSTLSGQIDSTIVKLCDLSYQEELGYVQMPGARIQTYYSCNVSYITQLPDEAICWAAAVATISNYLKGTNYTAAQVARAYYGANYNYILNTTAVAELMRNTYNLDYTYRIAIRSAVIYDNIANGYPIVGNCIYTWNNDINGHATTIYGINIVSGYIVLMDPSMGSVTVYVNDSGAETNTYTYRNTYWNVDMTLESGICHSWGD